MLQLAVVLLVVGMLALILELIIPGFDGFICGIVGIAALFVAAIIAVIFHPMGWLVVGIGFAAILLICGLLFNFVTRRQLAGRVILNDTLAEDSNTLGDIAGMVGKVGVAVTLLRPYGEVDFNGVRLEVSSSGPMLEKGTKVRVTETQGTKIVVVPVDGN